MKTIGTGLFKKLLLPVTAVLVLAALAAAQNSQGGVFQPAMDYIVGGQWTWRGTVSPWIVEGATDDAFETTLSFPEPTADQTRFLGGGNAATVAGVRAGTTALDGSNPTSVTTGLSVLAACSVHTTTEDAPGLGPISFTILRTATAGQLDIYAWAATSSSNPTLIASASTRTVEYICFGTP